MFSQRTMVLQTLSILFFLVSGSLGGHGLGQPSCSDTDLVVYSLTFETYWTRHKFPKQYPEHRPPAHWSKLVGMTHNEQYTLFRVGQTASQAIKVFAETGRTDLIAAANHTFDEFYSQSIRSGAGRTEVNFFADGNHTMVSLAVKIIPSPDWFVGVDSFLLCNRGKWVDSAAVEGHPIDAGTDSGFTFTAPNWETDPPEKITQITSRYPEHPASSFYYPTLPDLPTIARFGIRKMKLYQLVKKGNIQTEHGQEMNPSPKPERPNRFENEITPPGRIYRSFKRKLRKSNYNHVMCQMENWSAWSRCNATCGRGYTTRTRKTALPSKKCPTMTEKKKCRNYAGCYGKYFTW